VPSIAPTGSPPPAVSAAPESPAAGRPLRPDPDAEGPRVFTLGEVATVETVAELELLQAERDWPGAPAVPAGRTAYTFLVRFRYDLRTPGPIEIGGGYYNAIGFTMRDDQGFEYPVIQGSPSARQPELRFGDLNFGQSVQGWLTIWAPESAFVELLYRPIADDSVIFRVLAPEG
jgi:hypothetical protein